MKTFLFLVCTVLFTNICKGNSSYLGKETLSYNQKGNYYKGNDTLLINIQQKIMDAFIKDKISQSDISLADLEKDLLKQSNSDKNGIIAYWYSYTCYYHSILYMTNNESKLSERILDEGIKHLDNVINKNSEHFALLAYMESLSIQFAPGIEAAFISERVEQNAEKALKLDSVNLRAYYVLGSNDFYYPEEYGGGKKAEGYLLKAVRLKNQSIPNPYLPSWGKSNAYEMLIKLYIRRKQFNEAKKYYQEALELFPDDYMIKNLADELLNH